VRAGPPRTPQRSMHVASMRGAARTLTDWPRVSRNDMGTPVTRAISTWLYMYLSLSNRRSGRSASLRQ
jgi:hypothetical protein